MGRKILFVTADEQRFDALGCYGGRIARTPTLDHLAATGIRYSRAYNQNVTCMPARSTIITGQHVATHGVYRNGYSLPETDPCVARYLKEQGNYRTALIGKAHWQPMTDHSSWEASAALRGDFGPYRGFDYLSLAAHSGIAYRCTMHYNRWLSENGGQYVSGFYPPVGPKNGPNNLKGGDTNAIQVHFNPCPKEFYHTDWVADQSINWLRGLGQDDDWFLWVSFPDPHHPFDPPASEKHRVNWRDLDLPPGHPGARENVEKILSQKPKHWLNFYLGKADVAEETPDDFVPATMTHDNVREINAMVHIQNELIDEALGRVLAYIRSRGWDDDVDIIYTTDHGTTQGDFGLMFKGPFHVDGLMRLPMIWRPAPSSGIKGGRVIDDPVGQVDLAPTFTQIAGLATPAHMEGSPLPSAPAPERDAVFCQWDADKAGLEIKLRSIYDRSGYVCTSYLKTNYYDGTEGELYHLGDDPHQWRNLWSDPAYSVVKQTLVDKIAHLQPAPRDPPLSRKSRT
jgi:arylsulfatase A-like enzyme